MLSNLLAGIGLLLVLGLTYGPGFLYGQTMQLEVAGLSNNAGVVHVLVYDRAAPFEAASVTELAAYRTRRARSGSMVFTFRNLRPRRYAVIVHHDENANEQFDTSVGHSQEGYGYSKNVGKSGFPSFDDAAFAFGKDAVPEAILVMYPR